MIVTKLFKKRKNLKTRMILKMKAIIKLLKKGQNIQIKKKENPILSNRL